MERVAVDGLGNTGSAVKPKAIAYWVGRTKNKAMMTIAGVFLEMNGNLMVMFLND